VKKKKTSEDKTDKFWVLLLEARAEIGVLSMPMWGALVRDRRIFGFFAINSYKNSLWVSKANHRFLDITEPNIGRCSKFFYRRTPQDKKKPKTEQSLMIPPHPKRVATLPCEISSTAGGGLPWTYWRTFHWNDYI